MVTQGKGFVDTVYQGGGFRGEKKKRKESELPLSRKKEEIWKRSQTFSSRRGSKERERVILKGWPTFPTKKGNSSGREKKKKMGVGLEELKGKQERWERKLQEVSINCNG